MQFKLTSAKNNAEKRIWYCIRKNKKSIRDRSSFVQKPYLRTKCFESNIDEEDIDLKNHFKIINKLNPVDSNDDAP